MSVTVLLCYSKVKEQMQATTKSYNVGKIVVQLLLEGLIICIHDADVIQMQKLVECTV